MNDERPVPFSVATARHGALARVAPAGELDLATIAQLEAALPRVVAGETLVIDLRELTFIDSSGVHLLMRLDVAARTDGWDLVVVRGQPAVQRVLDLCHVGDRIRTVGAPADVSPALG
jgi:anti-anti-sigma factor